MDILIYIFYIYIIADDVVLHYNVHDSFWDGRMFGVVGANCNVSTHASYIQAFITHAWNEV